jgi:hypothetical protein
MSRQSASDGERERVCCTEQFDRLVKRERIDAEAARLLPKLRHLADVRSVIADDDGHAGPYRPAVTPDLTVQGSHTPLRGTFLPRVDTFTPARGRM